MQIHTSERRSGSVAMQSANGADRIGVKSAYSAKVVKLYAIAPQLQRGSVATWPTAGNMHT